MSLGGTGVHHTHANVSWLFSMGHEAWRTGLLNGVPAHANLSRGLPGSGKSHIAKKLKDAEVEEGGDAPRIHSIDDYFITVRPSLALQDSTCSYRWQGPILQSGPQRTGHLP
jgi:hypothetical protein